MQYESFEEVSVLVQFGPELAVIDLTLDGLKASQTEWQLSPTHQNSSDNNNRRD